MARVNFGVGLLREMFDRTDAQPKQIRILFEALQDAANSRQVNAVMGRANVLMEAHGVEAIRRGDDIIATYVNFGDAYVTTLLYDTEANTFYLTSYGDWVEHWNEAHPQTMPCERCGEEFPPDDLNYYRDPNTGGISNSGVCDNCESTKVAFWDWSSAGKPPLIAMLRSTKAVPVAVHLWSARDDERISSRSKVDLLAFSVPMPVPYVFSAKQIAGRHRGPDVPYIYTWPELLEEAKHAELGLLDVAFTAEPITIDADQFTRLRVAWDAFIEGGHVQTMPEFLESP